MFFYFYFSGNLEIYIFWREYNWYFGLGEMLFEVIRVLKIWEENVNC